jgi:hypothetical protein
MCLTPKAPKLKPIYYPNTPTNQAADAAKPMASPEDINASGTAGALRTSGNRKSLRIDLSGSEGSGLNVPQG